MRGRARGFTLVELAIVLVIIGIILGAVLKGQELINNAKAKRLQNDLRGLEAAIWTYYDRKGAFPGDCNRDGIIGFGLPVAADPTLTFTDISSTPSEYCASSTTDEADPDRPFSDLRASNILNYSTPNNMLAKHIFGKQFAIGNVYNGAGNYPAIAIYGIPAWVAKMIDVSIDGSEDGTTGRVRNFSDQNNVNGTAWPTDDQNNQIVSLVYYFDRIP